MSHDNEEWCKFWRKTDLFQKWHEFGEFWPEQSKVWKICTSMGSFWPKYNVWAKKVRKIKVQKVSFKTLKDAKFEEKLTCGLETDMMNVANFHHRTQNLLRICVSWPWTMMQHLKRNWLVVSKLALGIWWILTRALESLKHLHFNGFLLTIVCNFCAWRYKGVMIDSTKTWCKI